MDPASIASLVAACVKLCQVIQEYTKKESSLDMVSKTMQKLIKEIESRPSDIDPDLPQYLNRLREKVEKGCPVLCSTATFASECVMECNFIMNHFTLSLTLDNSDKLNESFEQMRINHEEVKEKQDELYSKVADSRCATCLTVGTLENTCEMHKCHKILGHNNQCGRKTAPKKNGPGNRKYCYLHSRQSY